MEQSIPALAKWLDSTWETIIGLCSLVYIASLIRFLVHMLLHYRVDLDHLSDLPMELTVPTDVRLGVGLSTLIACACASLTNLLHVFSSFSVIVVLGLDFFILFFSLAPFVSEVYWWRRIRLQMEEEIKRHNRDKNENIRPNS